MNDALALIETLKTTVSKERKEWQAATGCQTPQEAAAHRQSPITPEIRLGYPTNYNRLLDAVRAAKLGRPNIDTLIIHRTAWDILKRKLEDCDSLLRNISPVKKIHFLQCETIPYFSNEAKQESIQWCIEHGRHPCIVGFRDTLDSNKE